MYKIYFHPNGKSGGSSPALTALYPSFCCFLNLLLCRRKL